MRQSQEATAESMYILMTPESLNTLVINVHWFTDSVGGKKGRRHYRGVQISMLALLGSKEHPAEGTASRNNQQQTAQGWWGPRQRHEG